MNLRLFQTCRKTYEKEWETIAKRVQDDTKKDLKHVFETVEKAMRLDVDQDKDWKKLGNKQMKLDESRNKLRIKKR